MNKHTRSVSLIDGHIEGIKDAEIKKALECCRDCKCKDCPCYNKETDGCKELDEQDILDLINRLQAKNKELDEKLIIQKGLIDTQKAEIERLQHENLRCDTKIEVLQEVKEQLEKDVSNAQMNCDSIAYDYELLKQEKSVVQSEAIKEFWMRFDKVLCENIGPSKRAYWKISSDGNNLVKEMTEVTE